MWTVEYRELKLDYNINMLYSMQFASISQGETLISSLIFNLLSGVEQDDKSSTFHLFHEILKELCVMQFIINFNNMRSVGFLGISRLWWQINKMSWCLYSVVVVD